jgi:DNA repair photolyase
MNVIYEPRGRAKEYAPLACNLYMGCTHGCSYCYAPGCMHKTSRDWHERAVPRKDVLRLFEIDAKILSGDHRRVLFCFLSDPYQPLESMERLTRRGIEIAHKHNLKIDILTKGDMMLISEDLPLMKQADVHLGITLSFINDDTRRKWEPHASSVEDRFAILMKAHAAGIYTWVSMEPVIETKEALDVIRRAHSFVDYWKIGKLNHNKSIEATVDWQEFREDVEALLVSFGAKYYIKDDLRKA